MLSCLLLLKHNFLGTLMDYKDNADMENVECTVKCTVQLSTQKTAQSFGQFGQMVECSFKN